MTIRIPLVCLLLATFIPALAGDGIPATAPASNNTNVQQIQQLAEKGDARAQYNLV